MSHKCYDTSDLRPISMSMSLSNENHLDLKLHLYCILTSWEKEEKEEEVQRHIISFPITIFQPLLGHFDKYTLNNSTACLIYLRALSQERCFLCCICTNTPAINCELLNPFQEQYDNKTGN